MNKCKALENITPIDLIRTDGAVGWEIESPDGTRWILWCKNDLTFSEDVYLPTQEEINANLRNTETDHLRYNVK